MNSFLTMLFAVLFTFLLCLNPDISLSAASDALRLCAQILVPSLFPFFVFSALLLSSGAADKLCRFLGFLMRPLFGLKSVCALPLVLGLLSGYPMGAHITSEMYKSGSITKDDAKRLLAFTNNSGPLFITGAVGGGILGNIQTGYFLYFIHILSAVLTGVLLNLFCKKTVTVPVCYTEKKVYSPSVPDAVKSSVLTILNLCGFVVFFAVILSLLNKIGIIAFISDVLCFFGIKAGDAALISGGIFEITTALKSCRTATLPFISFVISLGGASVLLQTLSCTSSAALPLTPYIGGKIICAVISAILTFLALQYFPYTVPTFAEGADVTIKQQTAFFALYLILTFLMCIMSYAILVFTEIYEKRHKKRNP